MLDGRVKTLHPRVHGGLLHVRSNPEHRKTVAEHGIEPIDLLVVNLYAFEATAARPGVTPTQLIENIDIGGPAMIRSGAKNFEDVAVVTAVSQYEQVAGELESRVRGAYTSDSLGVGQGRLWYNGGLRRGDRVDRSKGCRRARSILLTCPRRFGSFNPERPSLRYGENPHQRAALYIDGSGKGIAAARQLQGKELSYNNLVDLDACWELMAEFDAAEEAAVAIVKHTNPCGVATGSTAAEAFRRALEADPISAFGGVIGSAREIDGEDG